VKFGESKTLALLTVAYSEYTMKKLNVFNVMGCSREDEKLFKMTKEAGSQKRKGQIQM
jgi:hypothetical protein